jgi:hypothetical protein
VANALRGTTIAGIGPVYGLTKPDNFAEEPDGRKGIIFFNGYRRVGIDEVPPSRLPAQTLRATPCK